MRTKLLASLTIAALGLPLCASAVPFSCDADVLRVLVYADGSVNVRQSAAPNYTFVCNLRGFRRGVSPEACQEWRAMLETAQTTARQVTFYYDVPTTEATSCATLPTYDQSPGPVYLGLR